MGVMHGVSTHACLSQTCVVDIMDGSGDAMRCGRQPEIAPICLMYALAHDVYWCQGDHGGGGQNVSGITNCLCFICLNYKVVKAS